MHLPTLSLIVLAILLPGVSGQTAPSGAPVRDLPAQSVEKPEANPNGLTPQELEAGWRLLFDGRSFHGWRNFRKAAVVADRLAVE